MNADVARYAGRVDVLAGRIADRLRVDGDAVAVATDVPCRWRVVLEAVMCDLYDLADVMRTAVTPCDIPECPEHTPILWVSPVGEGTPL